MIDPMLACHEELRRQRVRDSELNGLDALDVSDDQRHLTVWFLTKAPPGLTRANVRIDGGRQVRDIKVTEIHLCREEDPDLEDCLRITVDRPGDFSMYTLRLVKPGVRGRPGTEPLEGLDPRYAELRFSFKQNCPSDLDCVAPADCPPQPLVEPEISYLARDYASFRQLILDRLALIMPNWKERHVPDIGIAVVELLAYIGDYLSYYQDAVATEAYLDTARLRKSVRRHVRLIDYIMHDGCNARGWVALTTTAEVTLRTGEFFFITGSAQPDEQPVLLIDELAAIPSGNYEVFESVLPGDLDLVPQRNTIEFWTWGNQECCLARGATSATLKDAPVLNLHAGDVLIFEELCGPRTGVADDADRSHRQAVRLTSVAPTTDELYEQPIVNIEWAPEDALRFPLCISAVGGDDCVLFEPVSVARGNVVLVDHGRTLTRCGGRPEPLDVPPAMLRDAGCDGIDRPRDPIVVPPVFNPTLADGPITQRADFPSAPQIARQQGQRVAGIAGQVRTRVEELWHKTEGGQTLSDDELEELRVIFGDAALEEAGLSLAARRPPMPPSAGQQAVAIGRLLAHFARLEERKIRRLEILAARARHGLVLGEAQMDEIVEMFGPTYAVGLEPSNPAFFGPAAAALTQDPRAALPVIRLTPDPDPGDSDWTPRQDLLESGPRDRHFVAEVDDAGLASLRFGNDDNGRAPLAGSRLLAEYRVGNGTRGNVGAEVISRIVLCGGHRETAITRVWNPLPAVGGTDPEPTDEVKLFAPATFGFALQRAITTDDYATLTEQLAGIQGASARLSWTGSWYEVQNAIDPLGTEDVDPRLLDAVRQSIFRYRRLGHDLLVQPARYVPLDLELRVCVLQSYLRAHVLAALLDAFSNRVLAGGRRGYFHPDNLRFGQNIYVSHLVAVAQAVTGVESVTVTRLRPLFETDKGELVSGVLPIGPLEIARLDNNPGRPENGRLHIVAMGGR